MVKASTCADYNVRSHCADSVSSSVVSHDCVYQLTSPERGYCYGKACTPPPPPPPPPPAVCGIFLLIFDFLQYLDQTADNLSGLPFKLHDFGYRGSTSIEVIHITLCCNNINTVSLSMFFLYSFFSFYLSSFSLSLSFLLSPSCSVGQHWRCCSLGQLQRDRHYSRSVHGSVSDTP